MKVNDLLEGYVSGDNRLTTYLGKLYEIAKDVINPSSYLRDDIGDANIWPAGPSSTTKEFIVCTTSDIDLTKMDLSDLYAGNREVKRALKAKTAKSRAINMEELTAYRTELNAVVKSWTQYGLWTIELCTDREGPGRWGQRETIRPEDFDADKYIIPTKYNSIVNAIYFRFHDDGSLDKE